MNPRKIAKVDTEKVDKLASRIKVNTPSRREKIQIVYDEQISKIWDTMRYVEKLIKDENVDSMIAKGKQAVIDTVNYYNALNRALRKDDKYYTEKEYDSENNVLYTTSYFTNGNVTTGTTTIVNGELTLLSLVRL